MTPTTLATTTDRPKTSPLAGLAGMGYALVAYVLFLGSFTAFAAAVHGIAMPWTLDLQLPVAAAILVNIALVASFAIQHTIMARASFKVRWTRIVPAHLERSTFVLIASILMLAIVFFWQEVPGTFWSLEGSWATSVLHAGFVLGYLGVVVASFLINHFHLFGLQQTWRHLRSQEAMGPVFHEPWAYRQVRHPMMTAVIVMMWSAPTMSASQALLATLFTLYAAGGIHFEERELAQELGEAYRAYQSRVRRRIIPGLY